MSGVEATGPFSLTVMTDAAPAAALPATTPDEKPSRLRFRAVSLAAGLVLALVAVRLQAQLWEVTTPLGSLERLLVAARHRRRLRRPDGHHLRPPLDRAAPAPPRRDDHPARRPPIAPPPSPLVPRPVAPAHRRPRRRGRQPRAVPVRLAVQPRLGRPPRRLRHLPRRALASHRHARRAPCCPAGLGSTPWRSAVLLPLALLARLWQVTIVPEGIWFDESHRGLDALRMLAERQLPADLRDRLSSRSRSASGT